MSEEVFSLPTNVSRFLCCQVTNDMTLKRVERVRISQPLGLLSYSIAFFFFLVIMPPSALDALTRLNVEYPMLFKLINSKKNRHSHAGVLEFVADEGKVYLPYWVSQIRQMK